MVIVSLHNNETLTKTVCFGGRKMAQYMYAYKIVTYRVIPIPVLSPQCVSYNMLLYEIMFSSLSVLS